MAYIPFAFGKDYFALRSTTTRKFMLELLKKLAKPCIEVNRAHIDITMQKSESGTYVNLINLLQGRHSIYYGTYDDIPEIWNVDLQVNKQYQDVRMPFGEKFTWEKTETGTIIHLEKLQIHSVIELVE